jgi:glycosyltransferase involved in cell wall biosynthesis
VSGPLVVLQSVPGPLPTTNPYNVMLFRSLAATPGATVLPFTWQRFLTGGFDVFHVHWLEAHLSGPSPVKNLARQLLMGAGLVLLRLRRRALVQTRHNLELPTGISRREVCLLRLAERWTTSRILINESTPDDGQLPATTILHGHYRDWFAELPRAETVPGRLAFFGRVRRYKNVAGLVSAFADTVGGAGPSSLQIAGNPSSAEFAAQLEEAARQDPRLSVDLGFIADPDLVTVITAAELVVLPYHEMHNSGSVLTALSLDRPVLVPDNDANRALAAEVGPGWVLRYSGTLTGAHLRQALETLRSTPPPARPDLDRRNWTEAGEAHLAAYRDAAARARRHRRGTPALSD